MTNLLILFIGVTILFTACVFAHWLAELIMHFIEKRISGKK